MVDGIEEDDKYRMVEDEFVSVAGTFTAHLHAAEYQRLKDAAKSKNAEKIRNISRPVTGDMTALAKQQQDARLLASKQRHGLRRVLAKQNGIADDSDDSDSPWIGTSLHGLMKSRLHEPSFDLKTMVPTTQNTRAAAGFQERSPIKSERGGQPPIPMYCGSDDDLDGPSTSAKQSLAGGRQQELTFTSSRAQANSRTPSVSQMAQRSRDQKASDNDALSDELDGAGILRRARERRLAQNANRKS